LDWQRLFGAGGIDRFALLLTPILPLYRRALGQANFPAQDRELLADSQADEGR